MSDTALEAVFRRDRALVTTALVAIAALAWAYVLWLAFSMSSMDMGSAGQSVQMSEMDMAEIAAPHIRAWSVADFAFMFLMWAVMMVAMMLPAATPMILIYASVARQASAHGKPFAVTTWFAAGYLLAWTGFAIFATLAQWTLESALLLTPGMASASGLLGAFILISAGIYQWTPLKEACLSQCQAPLFFIQRHGGFQREPSRAVSLGARHGLYCIGCCWALMALLFVGGVMNLLWIAGLSVLVLIEKVVPAGTWIPRISGIALAAAGTLLLISAGLPALHL